MKDVFGKLGYMESSSADLFDQFLKTGMGAKPLIAGYDSQLLEFAVEEPETWEQLSSDMAGEDFEFIAQDYGIASCLDQIGEAAAGYGESGREA